MLIEVGYKNQKAKLVVENNTTVGQIIFRTAKKFGLPINEYINYRLFLSGSEVSKSMTVKEIEIEIDSRLELIYEP